MKKGYWSGQVLEIKSPEKWNKYLEKYTAIAEKEIKNKT